MSLLPPKPRYVFFCLWVKSHISLPSTAPSSVATVFLNSCPDKHTGSLCWVTDMLQNHLFPRRNIPAPQWARASSLPWLHYHTHTHQTQYYSSGRMIRPTQRPLPDKTLQTSMPPGGIRTRQSQQGNSRRPKPYTARPPGSAVKQYYFSDTKAMLLKLWSFSCNFCDLDRFTYWPTLVFGQMREDAKERNIICVKDKINNKGIWKKGGKRKEIFFSLEYNIRAKPSFRYGSETWVWRGKQYGG